MTVEVTVYSDYVCPYCLLAEGVIEKALAGKDVDVRWRPFELRPEPAATLRPEDDYLPRVWADSVYPMARRLGVSIVLPKVSPQPYTHTAFEGFLFADEQGRGREYNNRVFRAFFQDQQDIGRVDVLTAVAASIGLDADGFRAALTDRRHRQAHRLALRHAVDVVGVRVVPTIIVGEGRIEGVPDAGQLTAMVDRLLSDDRSHASPADAPAHR